MMKDQPLERKYQLFHNYWLSCQNTSGRKIEFNVVEYCEEQDLDELEQHYIDYFKPHLNTVGMTDGLTIDERIANDREISWILDLPTGWFCWEDEV